MREFEFLEPLTVSLLTQHRVNPPFGMNGGDDGKCGGQRLIRPDNSFVLLPSSKTFDVETGDRLVIETPGGGGFGRTNLKPVMD